MKARRWNHHRLSEIQMPFSILPKTELFRACLWHDLIVLRSCLLLPARDSERTGSDSKECWWLNEWHTWHLVRAADTALEEPRAPSNERKMKGVFPAVVHLEALSWASTLLCLPPSQPDACGVPNLLNPLSSTHHVLLAHISQEKGILHKAFPLFPSTFPCFLSLRKYLLPSWPAAHTPEPRSRPLHQFSPFFPSPAFS